MKIHHYLSFRKAVTQAFTLIEMVLVLAIVSLLVGAGAVMLSDVLGGAEVQRAEADISTINTALVTYRTTTGQYPTQAQGLRALVERPQGAPRKWKKVMERKLLIDPWQNEYQYVRPAKKSGKEFDIFSTGKDMIPGTDDDIGNWGEE